MDTGNCTTLPTALMVDFAELLCDTIDGADWAFFAKNGGDTTSLALMVARAATGRDKAILFHGHYHGVAPWTQKLGHPGITAADVTNNLYATWGDLAGLRRIIEETKGQIAVLMATPYHHPVFEDNQVPDPGWWAAVRKLCTDNGIVLAIDDVRAASASTTAARPPTTASRPTCSATARRSRTAGMSPRWSGWRR
jgi:glutamate-1-semialdehyde 2,1-aminomutase